MAAQSLFLCLNDQFLMEPSFSAASLVFLAAPARAEIIAPDLLLLLGLGRRWLDVCKLFQEVKAHCLAGQFHCEDLLADVLHVHFTGLEGFTDGPRESDLKRSSGGVICISSSGV